MEWTRSWWMRTIAMAASVGLVVTHWDERDLWFWVGVALLVLNVTGLLTAGSRARRDREQLRAAESLGVGPLVRGPEDGESRCLAELLSVPGVAAAFAAGPQAWRQVSYLDDPPLGPTSAEELAAFVWIEHDEGWEIGLGDEVKPYLDLDLEESEDPIIEVLKAHAAVQDAYHEDREVYRVEERRPIGVEEFAELTARALVSHHVHAAARS